MTITATVTALRGCAHAEITIAPLALVAGINGQGKTSILQGIAAALTGSVLPIEGLTKGTAGLLVHDGDKDGGVVLTGPDGVTSITWPACKTSSEGRPLRASTYAVGLQSLVTDNPTTRAATLGQLLKAAPTLEALTASLDGTGIDVKPIWANIEKFGWDRALDDAKETGAKTKGKWESITREKYGSKKAAEWKPAGWSLDLQSMKDESDLGAEAAKTEDRRLAVVRLANVNDARVAELRAHGAQKPDLLAAETKAQRAYSDALRDVERLTTERRELGAPADDRDIVACPCCGEDVRVIVKANGGYLLEKPPAKRSDAEEAAFQVAYLAASDKITAASQVANEHRETMLRAQRAVAAAIDAETEAKALEARNAKAREAGSAETGGMTVGQATLAAQKAAARLTAYRQRKEADAYHYQIEANSRLIEVLDPKGLRKTALHDAIEAWNADIADLCAAAGWSAVTVDSDTLAIAYGGRPYGLLSASEQVRCAVTLQVAIALQDGSDALVIDGADILDSKGRMGLIGGLLPYVGLSAVVGMTLLKRGSAPDLAAHGIGATYWVEGGVAEPLTPAAQQAAE